MFQKPYVPCLIKVDFGGGENLGTLTNRGRHISIEMLGGELGDAELIHNAPLMAMIYDRLGKGDDLVIEVGRDEVTYAHTVDSPTEVLTGQDSNGLMLAVWISDAAGTKTLVKLKAD